MRMKVYLASLVVLLLSAWRCLGGALDGYVIVIDPGHGLGYPGAQGAAGESSFSHWTGIYVAEELRRRGATVYLTPSSLNVNERARMANIVHADLLISIHGDDSNNRFGQGVQTIYELSRPTNDPRSRSAAGIIQGSMVTALGRDGAADAGFGRAGDGRTKVSSLGVLREATVPSVLVEVGLARGSPLRQRLDQEVSQMRTAALSGRPIITPEGNSLHVVNGLVSGIQTYLHDSRQTTPGDKPGGVLLDRPADVLFRLSNIKGAAFDRAAGRLVLIGERRTVLPALVPSYLGTALKCAGQGAGPGVSIDPGGPGGSMQVRYIGPVEGSALGYVLFEADRLLKCLSLGRDNLTGAPMPCPISGFRTFTELLGRTAEWRPDSARALARFWFVPRRVSIVLNHSGDAALFDEVTLELRAEVMDQKAPDSVRQAAEAFAEHFTKHYDEFALEYPILSELKQVAQAAALARWFADERIPVPESLLEEDGESRHTPLQTPAIAVDLERHNADGFRVHIAGGVDLSSAAVKTSYSRTFRMPGLILAGLRGRDGDRECYWRIPHDGSQNDAVSIGGKLVELDHAGGARARLRVLICLGVLLAVGMLAWASSRWTHQSATMRASRCTLGKE